MIFYSRRFASFFKPGQGAGEFFLSILIWGIAYGCFHAVLNNYLADVVGMSPFQRGTLEFFREMPGLLLVFIIALMHRCSEWKIIKIGLLVSLAGIAGLLVMNTPAFAPVIFFIVLWSTGEHIIMPVRSTLAMNIARKEYAGRSLGFVTGAVNAGHVAGCIAVAGIFWFGVSVCGVSSGAVLYNAVWFLTILLLAAAFFCIARFRSHESFTRRPRLFFRAKYCKFYALELFYGARKQVFYTFAPYVLIKIYGMDTAGMALLTGGCALANIFFAPLIGRLTDRIGYKNVMIYDTVILFFVCMTYGYAGNIFAASLARWIVCINFLLDAVISTTSMATSMYVRDISSSPEETTASLTTGISINHLISIFAALGGGLMWERFGFGVLFLFAAIMALCNSAFALSIPDPLMNKKA